MSTFELVHVSDVIKRRPPEWLVKGVLPDKSVGCLWGNTAAGKTFFALDLVICVAGGLPFFGRDVTQGGAVYVAAEGSGGIPQRLRIAFAHRGLAPSNLPAWMIETAPDLARGDDADAIGLVAAIRALAPDGVRLVVVDTLAASFGNGDENTTQHMNQFVRNCNYIRRELGCCVIALHHTGHKENRARGSKSLINGSDVFMKLSETSSGARRVECEKMKDAEPFEPLTFRLEKREGIHCGKCDDSLVVIETDACDDDFTDIENRLLALRADFPPPGPTYSEWFAAAALVDISESTFKRTLKEFKRQRVVKMPPPGQQRGWRYALEEKVGLSNGDALFGQLRGVA